MVLRNSILKVAILLSIIISVISCKLFLTKRIYDYAKSPVSDEQLKIYTELLDSSYMFYREWIASSNIDEKPIKQYAIMRFFPDGRCQTASFDSIPTLQKIHNLFGSYADHYKIEKGVLKLEVYRGELASMGYWKGKIYPDSLVFSYVDAKFKIPQVYIKAKIR
ncbi:MAG TPA: hypothetical protein VK173_04740 [Lacibacter sp.]|nr:hypothetical protein [Lacibacter sp.]